MIMTSVEKECYRSIEFSFLIWLQEKEQDVKGATTLHPWIVLQTYLQQLVLAEKSYMEIGFLQTKNKGFLRKDVIYNLIIENDLGMMALFDLEFTPINLWDAKAGH